jgi:hypothetical protein
MIIVESGLMYVDRSAMSVVDDADEDVIAL